MLLINAPYSVMLLLLIVSLLIEPGTRSAIVLLVFNAHHIRTSS